jgi:thiol-disulfide isomerase/thioredoxin
LLAAAGVFGGIVYFFQGSTAQPIDLLLKVPENPPTYASAGIAEIKPDGPVTAYAEPGRHTVITFYSQSCPGCRQLDGHLDRFAALRPDVAIRKVDLGKSWSSTAAARDYGEPIRSVPHVIIISADGDVIARDSDSDKAGLELLHQWINAELRRDVAVR